MFIQYNNAFKLKSDTASWQQATVTPRHLYLLYTKQETEAKMNNDPTSCRPMLQATSISPAF